MMTKRDFRHISIPGYFVSVLYLAAACASDVKIPDVTPEGLLHVEGSKLAVVYVDPEADLSAYQRVRLVDAAVAFRKNWLRDQRSRSASSMRITSKDADRIKTELATEFRKVFTATLTEAGYELTDEVAEDVLLVKPAIINLDMAVADPHSVNRSYTYAKSAGEMTLYVELFDAQTGDLLAKAYDRQSDRDSQIYTWVTPSTNRALAERIIKGWSEVLVDALDEARANSDGE